MAKFSLKNRLKSFTHAFRGIGLLVKNEHNSWIHIFASILVVILGFYYQINNYEWFAIILSIGIVLMAETFNSAIEELSDKVESKQDTKIKNTKDLAAGAVLIAAIMAIVIGCIIFIPKIF